MTIYSQKQRKIANKLESTSQLSNWKDWRWQLKHAVNDIETFKKLSGIQFSKSEEKKILVTTERFPLRITPYYLSLIDVEDYKNDPIFKQSFPDPLELSLKKFDMADPLHEESDSPVEGITHRYPDRVLMMVSNMCSMYCRHCTRKRKVGDIDYIPSKKVIQKGIQYIKNTPQVRDVLLSGGDPFMLSDDFLDWILAEITSIPHVEMVRIGTRMPVVLPYRVTDDLITVLKKYQPLYINSHFNHPREMTASAREAIKKLADAGFPLGNQSVLLSGVNDCPRIFKRLTHLLLQNRIRPYYIYQCDMSEGLSHFRTPIGKGIEIIESLRGHTSGLAVPTYVIDAPGGGGKIPITPNYIISWSTNKIVLRNYQGVICTYKEPESYVSSFCDRNCEACNLQLKTESPDEYRAVGIEKLLSDSDDTIALSPIKQVSYNPDFQPEENE
jgi:lysine 2,3-aminomutase